MNYSSFKINDYTDVYYYDRGDRTIEPWYRGKIVYKLNTIIFVKFDYAYESYNILKKHSKLAIESFITFESNSGISVVLQSEDSNKKLYTHWWHLLNYSINTSIDILNHSNNIIYNYGSGNVCVPTFYMSSYNPNLYLKYKLKHILL